jgi:hypothetical protein
MRKIEIVEEPNHTYKWIAIDRATRESLLRLSDLDQLPRRLRSVELLKQREMKRLRPSGIGRAVRETPRGGQRAVRIAHAGLLHEVVGQLRDRRPVLAEESTVRRRVGLSRANHVQSGFGFIAPGRPADRLSRRACREFPSGITWSCTPGRTPAKTASDGAESVRSAARRLPDHSRSRYV